MACQMIEGYYILVKFNYVPGWSSEDKDWQYRLSIYYATKRDTNKFICRNPRGMLNKISVEVTGNKERCTYHAALGNYEN